MLTDNMGSWGLRKGQCGGGGMYTSGLGIGPFLRGSETQAAVPAGGSSQTVGGRGGRAFQAEGGPRRESMVQSGKRN